MNCCFEHLCLKMPRANGNLGYARTREFTFQDEELISPLDKGAVGPCTVEKLVVLIRLSPHTSGSRERHYGLTKVLKPRRGVSPLVVEREPVVSWYEQSLSWPYDNGSAIYG